MAKHKGQGQRAQDQRGQQADAQPQATDTQPQSADQQPQSGDHPAPSLAEFGDSGLSGALGAPVWGGDTRLGSAVGGLPTAMPDAQPSPVATVAVVPVKVPDLDTILASLTPDQLLKIRQKAIGEGVVPAASLGGTKSADGSLTLSVTLDPMVTEQLELWAEADGCTLVEEAQKRITESLQNYLYGDWSVNEQIAAPASTNASAAK